MQKVYSLVDGIFCINLKSRKDKYDSMKTFAEKEGIQKRMEFYRPEKHPDGGIVGCFTSHVEVIRQARSRNYQQILIFEDDTIHGKGYDSMDYGELVQFLQENKHWEMMNLAPLILPWRLWNSHVHHHIFQSPSLFTSAYILNQKGMDRILDAPPPPKNTHLDLFYCGIFQQTMYNVVPLIFDQDPLMIPDNMWIRNSARLSTLCNNVFKKLQCSERLSMFKYYYKERTLLLLIIIVLIVLLFIVVLRRRK